MSLFIDTTDNFKLLDRKHVLWLFIVIQIFLYLNLYSVVVFLGNPATRSMNISYLDISPKPIRIPGNITSAYDIRINRRIGRYENSPLQLNVTLDKALLGRWHAVPCLNKIGTWLV